MSDINFQPIFDYIDQNNQVLEDEIMGKVRTVLQEELGDIKTSITNLSAQVKQYHEEMLVSGHRIDRLEDWAKQVGQKIGVPITF
jgi:uncharacterized coiled-coil DUF342 family protein